MLHKFSLLLCLAFSLHFAATAQQTDEQFNLPIKYLLALPDGYNNDTAKKWPLLIFLHGSGESGNDLTKVKVHGPPKLIEEGKKLPFIVVSPQSEGNGWPADIMQRFLRSLKNDLRVDKSRIYLTGLSMGGFGTWNWATKYPREFAAIVPICGGGDSSEVDKLRDVAVWCFHGAKDRAVPVQESYAMMNALKRHNPTAKLTIYPDAEHDSWTETYNNDSLYTWLLAQQRKVFTASNIAPAKLAEYAGSYSRTGSDTLRLVIENDKLVALTGGPKIEIKHFADDRFFFEQGDLQYELKFTRNNRRKIEKMLFYDDRIVEFKKL